MPQNCNGGSETEYTLFWTTLFTTPLLFIVLFNIKQIEKKGVLQNEAILSTT